MKYSINLGKGGKSSCFWLRQVRIIFKNNYSKRVPFLYWGDLVLNRKPIIRRVLFGIEAHLTMYFYVYVQDFLRLNLLLQYVQQKKGLVDFSFLHDFNETHKILYPDLFDGGGIQKDEFSSILLSDICIGKGTRIVELGSTLGASIIKFNIIKELKDVNHEFRWVGIENSSALEHLSESLHKNKIDIVKSYKDLERLENSHLLSRFVASYVFESASDFATWLIQNFESFVIEDAFSLDGDIKVFNHGMPEIFMDFMILQLVLIENNFNIYVENMYFDYPAKSNKCINLRIIGTKDVNFLQKYQNSINSKKLIKCDASEPYKFLNSLHVDKNYLKNIKHNKNIYPIWAETPITYSRMKQRYLYIKNRLKNRAYPSTVKVGPHIASTLRSYLDKI
jgi:hypothetical protein